MARQRGSTWQADVGLKSGKRLRPGGFATEADAALWEAQARSNIEKGVPVPPPPSMPDAAAKALVNRAGVGGISLGDLRDLVLKTPKPKGRGSLGGWLGSKDYRNSEARSQMAVDFFGANTAASSISLADLERYARALKAAGNGSGTINRKLASVSKMLTFAHTRGLIATVPAIPLEGEPEGRIRFLTLEEEHQALAMLEVMGEHDLRQLTIFLLETGCRVSEALKLEHGDYSLDGARPSVTFWITKGGKGRSVPLTQPAIAALRFFTGRWNAGPFAGLDYWQIRATWDRARVRLGAQFADVVLHVMRHTCATRLLRGGMDPARVQKWLGHADIKTTMGYTHVVDADLDLGIEALERARTGNVVPLRRTA